MPAVFNSRYFPAIYLSTCVHCVPDSSLDLLAFLSSSVAHKSLLVCRNIVQKVLKSAFLFPSKIRMISSICSALLGLLFTTCASAQSMNPPAAFCSLLFSPLFTITFSLSSPCSETSASLFHSSMGPMSLSVEQQDSGAAGRLVITKQVSQQNVHTNTQVETCTKHKNATVG